MGPKIEPSSALSRYQEELVGIGGASARRRRAERFSFIYEGGARLATVFAGGRKAAARWSKDVKWACLLTRISNIALTIMNAVEFTAALTGSATLTIPPEIASQLPGAASTIGGRRL